MHQAVVFVVDLVQQAVGGGEDLIAIEVPILLEQHAGCEPLNEHADIVSAPCERVRRPDLRVARDLREARDRRAAEDRQRDDHRPKLARADLRTSPASRPRGSTARHRPQEPRRIRYRSCWIDFLSGWVTWGLLWVRWQQLWV